MGQDRPADESELPEDLLAKAKAGDSRALEELFSSHIRQLRCLAHGRLPASARGLMDTEDVVQDTLLRVFRVLEEFESGREVAFKAYLKRSLFNRLQDTYREGAVRPEVTEFESRDFPDSITPLQQAVSRQRVERYKFVLSQFSREDRFAVLARVELGCSYGEIAKFLELPTSDAARMRVARAVERLVKGIKKLERQALRRP